MRHGNARVGNVFLVCNSFAIEESARILKAASFIFESREAPFRCLEEWQKHEKNRRHQHQNAQCHLNRVPSLPVTLEIFQIGFRLELCIKECLLVRLKHVKLWSVSLS